MEITYVSINGKETLKGVDRNRPVFFWKAAEECREFTLELSDYGDFSRTLFLRDTDRNYYPYDSVPLKPGKEYYFRVRSGLGLWKQISFVTEEEV